MTARPLALIVEDSADQSALLHRYLDREGFDVFAVADAEGAVAAFAEIEPRVAVIDLLLPGMSGSECILLLRARFPDCFVVVSSVLDAVDYPPADAALPKPLTGAALHRALAGVRR